MGTNHKSKNLPCAGPTIIVAHGWPSQANLVHYMWHLVLFSHFFSAQMAICGLCSNRWIFKAGGL